MTAPLPHVQCERSPEQPAEAVNHSWPVTPLHCQQPAKWRTMQTRPFHSIIPARSMWIRLVKHISHSHSWKQRDKCTGNLECWGEDWVTTGETGFSTFHLHISSEEGWPPVSKTLGATNLQWSKAWWHKPSRPTLQTLPCQLTSEHSQPLSFLLAKVHQNNFSLLSTGLLFCSYPYSFTIPPPRKINLLRKPLHGIKSATHPPGITLNEAFNQDFE